MIKPAIVVVGYNRPLGVKRLLKSIGEATYQQSDIPLIISIDESNLSDEVEKVARDFEWKYGSKEIKRYPKRQGLREHIIQCGNLSIKYGAVIILEDDLVVGKDFYTYVCKAHEQYADDTRICGVALYSYGCNVFTHLRFIPEKIESDVYLGDMVVTWGQSWTKSQWEKFRIWFEKNNKVLSENKNIPREISSWTRSWGRYFANYMYENQVSYIYPYISRTTCFSDFGEHNRSRIPLTYVQVPIINFTPSRYTMLSYEKLIHYDSFYERVLSKDQVIKGISGDKICIDVNNMKTITEKKYVITNSKIFAKKIASFGLTRKPIERNIIDDVDGNELILYEIDKKKIRKWQGKGYWYKYNYKRMKYEFCDAHWRLLLKYTPLELFGRLINIFFK